MKRADKKNQKPKLSFQDDDAEPAFVVKKIKNTFISHSIVSATENNYSQESLKELKSKQKSLPIASPAVDIQDIPEIEIPDSSQILKFKQTRLENRLKETDFFSLTDDQDYEMEPVDYLEDVEMFPDNSGQLINFGDSSIKNANNIAREVMISDINMVNDDIGEWETDQMIKGGLKPKKQKLIKPKIPNIQKLPSYLEKLSLIESNLAVLSSNVKLLEQEHDIKNEQIKNCKIEIKSLEAINQQDAEKYNFFKEFQIFCNNFADMLNEKIPLLETLENEYIQSFKNPALDNSINQDLYDSFFIDVDPDFTSLHYILTKFFSRWRNIYSIDYESAYGLLTVPSIAEIFIRFEISCVDFLSFAIKLSSFNWFKDITSFDSKLLLKVIEKFVLPRLDCLIENNFEFDNKTRNLISVYMDINEYCKNSLVYSESISKLVVSLKNRVSKLISNEFSESEIFLENISFWNGIISTEIILQIVIELIEYKCLVDVLNKIKSFGVSNADFKLVYQIIRFIPDECLKVYSDCYSTPAAFGGICKLLEEFSGYIQAVEDVNEAVDDLGKSLVLIYAYNQASVVEKMRN